MVREKALECETHGREGFLCLESYVSVEWVDLVGSDVRFHHSKLNTKWSDGGEEVKWHQDIQFWLHIPATADWYKGTYTSIFAHQQGTDS